MFLRFVKADEGDYSVIAGKKQIGRMLDNRFNVGVVYWYIDFFDQKYTGTEITIKEAKRSLKHQWFNILNDLNVTWKK